MRGQGKAILLTVFSTDVPIKYFGPDPSSLITSICRYRIRSDIHIYLNVSDTLKLCSYRLLNLVNLILHKLLDLNAEGPVSKLLSLLKILI